MGEYLELHLQRLIRCKARGEELQEAHVQEKGQCGTISAEKGKSKIRLQTVGLSLKTAQSCMLPEAEKRRARGKKASPILFLQLNFKGRVLGTSLT